MIDNLKRLNNHMSAKHGGAGHIDKWVANIGGFFALLAILFISQSQLGLSTSQGVVASMGATAVLLFAVPHGPLSQPWPVFGGHLISAIIGVACARYFADPLWAAPFAVGFSIGAMYYLNCIHPPGGATALTAVMGGEAVHQLGFQFVITPVLLNVALILAVATLFNAPFAWRRYPLTWARARSAARHAENTPLTTASGKVSAEPASSQ